jgi:hypothetical protein
MTENQVQMKKLTKAFSEVYLSVRNHPEQETELGNYLLDSLGLMASRMANQGPESLEEVCTQIGSGVYSRALEFLKVKEKENEGR